MSDDERKMTSVSHAFDSSSSARFDNDDDAEGDPKQVDLADPDLTMEGLVHLLCSSLPQDPTKGRERANMLSRAMTHVHQKTEVQYIKAKTAYKVSHPSPLASIAVLHESFWIPQPIILNVLSYIPQCDLNNIALVNKRFLNATRSPTLWTKIDDKTKINLETYDEKYGASAWLEVLFKSQFASLTVLDEKISLCELGNSWKTRSLLLLQEACPSLAKIHGNSIEDLNPYCIDVSSSFPKLTSISVTLPSIFLFSRFCECAGQKLLELDIRYDDAPLQFMWLTTVRETGYDVGDSELIEISKNNPNLTTFTYVIPGRVGYRYDCDLLSNTGVKALLKGCQNLKTLQLIGTGHVTLDAFEEVAADDFSVGENLVKLYVNRLGRAAYGISQKQTSIYTSLQSKLDGNVVFY